MSDKKHTPGPWKIEDGDFIYHLNENGHNSFDVSVNPGCSCDDCKKLPEADIEAITNIMANSRELLEALEAVKSHLEILNEQKGIGVAGGIIYGITVRAIAKAHGEIK